MFLLSSFYGVTLYHKLYDCRKNETIGELSETQLSQFDQSDTSILTICLFICNRKICFILQWNWNKQTENFNSWIFSPEKKSSGIPAKFFMTGL